jgi:hypothetical protein
MNNRSIALLTILVASGPWAAVLRATIAGGKRNSGSEQKMNAVYAANHLPAYFAYYSPDFTQWLPEGHSDLPQYEKMWTGFIKSGGRMESDHIPDRKVQMCPS